MGNSVTFSKKASKINGFSGYLIFQKVNRVTLGFPKTDEKLKK